MLLTILKRSNYKLKKLSKINAIMIILVIFGSFFANINMVSSIIPKNGKRNYDNVIETQAVEIDTITLDYETVNEVFDYFKKQAMLNGYEETITVISSGLLFESENSLIIIGHGHFDSKNQYRIADYTSSRIKNLAEQKQIVALLGCYSNAIKLDNEIQLTYNGKINLRTAIYDLVDLLDWSVSHEFLPSVNIGLHYLDPGGSGNGWSISNPPPLFNTLKRAYCPVHDIYWNLDTETGVRSLSTFMYNHLNTAIRLNYEGQFLTETSLGSNSYYLNDEAVQFDLWMSEEGGVWKYLNFANIKVNGVPKSSYTGSLKVFDIESEMMTALGMTRQESKYALAAIFGTLGIAFCTLGWQLIAYAIAASAGLLKVLAFVGGILGFLIGATLVIIALVACISAYYAKTED